METEEILAVHSMLHLIYHRNKNQHGKTKWWKWLSILKRVTLNLARSLDQEPLLPYGGTDSPIESHKRYLAMHVVPRCYLAFSTVVADGQFSTLGTVLLATLAHLTKVTGIDRDLKHLSQAERKESRISRPNTKAPSKKEDLGEPVHRAEGIPRRAKVSEAHNSPAPVTRPHDTVKKARTVETEAPKKKKRKKNAIDDLFAGVL